MAAIISLSLRNNPSNIDDKLRFLIQVEEVINQNRFYVVGDDLLRIYYRDTHILPSELNKIINFIKNLDGFRHIVIDLYHTTNLHKV